MKKKAPVLALLLALLALAASCALPRSSPTDTPSVSAEDPQADVEFTATVLEINDNNVLVEPCADEAIYQSADRITFSTANLGDIGVAVGDTLTITFNGIVLESYPAQITASKWAILEKAQGADSSHSSGIDTDETPEMAVPEKPVIYLYPEKPTAVSVELAVDGTLDFTYPKYNGGWHVTAYPDGRLVNEADGKEYSYLFWEGRSATTYDWSKGFVVKGCDTVAFLEDKLSFVGLTPREYNEFIVYWFPRMENNPYNLISFQGEAYTRSAKLKISPEPDSLLRVFMAYKPLEEAIDIQEQELASFERAGFTVIEWGGALVE